MKFVDAIIETRKGPGLYAVPAEIPGISHYGSIGYNDHFVVWIVPRGQDNKKVVLDIHSLASRPLEKINRHLFLVDDGWTVVQIDGYLWDSVKRKPKLPPDAEITEEVVDAASWFVWFGL